MSDMKCPFCQQELESVLQLAGAGGLVEEAYLLCSKCNTRGERKLWQELIRTRKALDVAVDALKSAHNYYEYCIQRDKDYDGDDINWDCTAMNMDNDISEALKQITALEQKD